MKLKVRAEGRPGIYLPEKPDLKAFIKSRKLKTIHNFIPTSTMMIGADHNVAGVLKDIDNSLRSAVHTKKSGSMNMGHALSRVLSDERGERLEVYDIGPVSEDDLDIIK